jgi:hypothetical protein
MREDNSFGWLDLHRMRFSIRPELSSAARREFGKLLANPESPFSRVGPLIVDSIGSSDLT